MGSIPQNTKRSGPAFVIVTNKIFFRAQSEQLALNAQGKTLAGQGYRQPNSTANVSYRRTLTPALSLLVNVTDVFDSNKIETVTDTDLLKETNVRRSDGRLVYIGLSYRLGGLGPTIGRRGPVRPGGERPVARPQMQD